MDGFTEAKDNHALVDKLLRNKVIESQIVEKAMRTVDRGLFFVDTTISPYRDRAAPIGHGQTISQPTMHAHCLELLKDHITKPKARVLDVGCGSGYLTACFAALIGEGGRVFGIDVLPELVTLSEDNINKRYSKWLENETITLEWRDGWKGMPEFAPFDAIHVGAAVQDIPENLLKQLAPGGRMIIPQGDDSLFQTLYAIDKSEDGKDITKTELMICRYVPLLKDYKVGSLKK